MFGRRPTQTFRPDNGVRPKHFDVRSEDAYVDWYGLIYACVDCARDGDSAMGGLNALGVGRPRQRRLPESSEAVGVRGVSTRQSPSTLYSATPFAFNTCHTFSGVIGISMCVTPRCRSASTTALTIAGGAPTVADSPTPFAPSG